MYCPQCGKEISDESNFCKYCGKQIQYGQTNDSYTSHEATTYVQDINPSNDYYVDEDRISIGFTALSFIFPIVGFILFYRWRHKTPNKAYACLYAGLISMLINIVVLAFS